MEMRLKEVWYFKYCKSCEHFDKKESEDPCWDCLNEPFNDGSHKPTRYKEKIVAEKSRSIMKAKK